MAEQHSSLAAIVAMDLPGLPRSRVGLMQKARRERWAKIKNSASGGGFLYALASLPGAARAELARRQLVGSTPIQSVANNNLALPRSGTAPDLKDHQRRRMDARLAILALVDALVAKGHTTTQAVAAVVAQAHARALPPEVMRLLPVANARAGATRTLARSTLFGWLARRQAGGGAAHALAPAGMPEAATPAWAETFLELYARPSKPNLTEVLDAWPAHARAPSYDQARRFLKRLDAVTRHKGRLGPRALKALRAYIVRDTANLWPGAVFVGDGHTFKAEVQHPLHGRPFRPEVTAILDVFTRRWVGWSVDLAENTWAVADALRHAVTTTTCCDILYYDNGSGAKNAHWDTDVVGLVARLGITKLHSAPWSSQARGVIERFHSTVLHRAARSLPTYVGQRMDKEARNAAFKLTRRSLREGNSSALLLRWDDFQAALTAEQARYNALPHSHLPRVIDAATGKRRFQSPDEAWTAAIATGWAPDPVGIDEARDLFRPHVLRVTSRGTVKIFDNLYFDPALEPLHGETVQVAYDIHDAARVVVRLADGRFVCTAGWNANSRDYVPVAFAARAREKRIEGRLKRLASHRDEAIAEGTPNLRLVASGIAAPAPLTDAVQRELATIEAELASPPAPRIDAAAAAETEKKARFARAIGIAQAIERGERVAETERAFLDRYRQLPEWFALKSMWDVWGDQILTA